MVYFLIEVVLMALLTTTAIFLAIWWIKVIYKIGDTIVYNITIKVNKPQTHTNKPMYKDPNPKQVSLNHYEYVVYCADILSHTGFSDIGLNEFNDLLVNKGTVSFYIKCRVRTGIINEELVQEIAERKAVFNRDMAVLIASQKFMTTEKEIAKVHKVGLWDYDYLNELEELAKLEKANKDAWNRLIDG